MELSEVIERARSLINSSETYVGAISQSNFKGIDIGEQRQRKCFVCNMDGHISWTCPTKKNKNNASKVICYRCGEAGHYASKCTEESKNG